MDRNVLASLFCVGFSVALRKESVDRNDSILFFWAGSRMVALRKESVDRNASSGVDFAEDWLVALRKESVDRNVAPDVSYKIWYWSLSARRAWIEMRVLDGSKSSIEGRSPQGERG